MAKRLKEYENKVIILEDERYYIYSAADMGEKNPKHMRYVGIYYDYNNSKVVFMADNDISFFDYKEGREPTQEENNEALNRFFYVIFEKIVDVEDRERLAIVAFINNLDIE